MELDATAGSCPASPSSALKRAGRSMISIAVPVISLSLLLLAWVVWREGPYTSASDLGYWLGVAGGSLMLVLLVYPLRKRYRALAVLGPLKHWFRFHLVAGIAGPVIVLFHSTFRIGSFNAAIALASMLLVVASGLVGRFVYRKIHHGLFGSRANVAELQLALEQQLESMHELLLRLPLVDQEIRQFSALVSQQPEGRWQRGIHFASLGLQRHLAGRRVHRAITRRGEGNTTQEARLQALARNIDDTLKAMQRTAQFSTYEKLFSLWHVVHIPFLCMLVVTAIVHVVAVHAY